MAEKLLNGRNMLFRSGDILERADIESSERITFIKFCIKHCSINAQERCLCASKGAVILGSNGGRYCIYKPRSIIPYWKVSKG